MQTGMSPLYQSGHGFKCNFIPSQSWFWLISISNDCIGPKFYFTDCMVENIVYACKVHLSILISQGNEVYKPGIPLIMLSFLHSVFFSIAVVAHLNASFRSDRAAFGWCKHLPSEMAQISNSQIVQLNTLYMHLKDIWPNSLAKELRYINLAYHQMLYIIISSFRISFLNLPFLLTLLWVPQLYSVQL